MNPERWQQIQNLFFLVLERSENGRITFLEEACAGDKELRQEVESLLASNEKTTGFVDGSALFDTALFLAESPSTIGRRIGQYRILDEIGRGGMGIVLLAVRDDDEFNKQVAIKLIKHGFDSDFIIERFHKERQILADFEHPNIARLLDGGKTSDGLPYFVMEYIKGKPLDDYCDQKRLATIERLKLFRQICSAVQYAHQHLVIHRDLKPSNILVTEEGTPKLFDFGIAKLLEMETGDYSVETATLMRAMTLEYASPEQISGEHITTASDVYSLGVVLYELLTGRLPYHFSSRSPVEIARVIIEEEPEKPSTAILKVYETNSGKGKTKQVTPESLSEVREGTPEKLRRRLNGDLDNIILRAIGKEKQRRYHSVEQLSEDIRRYLEGLPIKARKDTFRYRAAKFIKRNKIAVAAAALVFLILISGIIATTWQARLASQAQARAERRFNDVRRLAHLVVFDYHDRIRDLAGSTPVRQKLVSDALDYLNSLAEDGREDASLQAEIADTYEKISSIQGGKGGANLGDTLGAIESMKKGQQIRQSLLVANPQDPGLRLKTAEAYRVLAVLLGERGDTESAAESYRKAVNLSEELLSIDPTNRDFLYQAAISYNSLGDFLLDAADWKGAVENEQRALSLFQSIPADDAESGSIRRSMALCHQVISRALKELNDRAGAAQNSAKAIEIFAQLCRQNPTNAQYHRSLGVSYFYHGEALDAAGRVVESIASFRQFATIAEEISAADSKDVRAFLDRSFAYVSIGVALKKTGQMAEAVSYLRRSVEIRRSVYEADPNDLYKKGILVEGMAIAVRALTESGNISAALVEGRKTIDLIAKIDENSEMAYIRGICALAHKNVAMAFEAAIAKSSSSDRRRLREEAHSHYQKCLDILLDMQSKGTLFSSDAPLIEESRQGISRCNSSTR